MRVLVVGSGGREHALAWRLAQDGAEVRVAPGNGGTRDTVALDPLDGPALADFAAREQIDLTIVGPEAPLAAGVADAFAARGLPVLGATRAAARLEWSKAFAKDFLGRHAIPTGRAEIVDSETTARRAIAKTGLPVVLKADGLASGKGVFVCHTPAEADAAVEALFTARIFGAAADSVLCEEYLEGPELSVLAFCDGERIAVMPPARDYKRLRDDDLGPNTGGMGGMARPAYATPSLLEDVERRVLRPTIDGMLAEGAPYRGILYAGLMLTRDGPKVLEFNCRFGDPETQLLMPLFESSFFETCLQTAMGELRQDSVRWRDGSTYGVVLAAPGYPEAPRTGEPITGLDRVHEGVDVFQSGTRREGDVLLTSGGRVLTVVGPERERVYAAAKAIDFEGKQYRRDIGAVSVGASR